MLDDFKFLYLVIKLLTLLLNAMLPLIAVVKKVKLALREDQKHLDKLPDVGKSRVDAD